MRDSSSLDLLSLLYASSKDSFLRGGSNDAEALVMPAVLENVVTAAFLRLGPGDKILVDATATSTVFGWDIGESVLVEASATSTAL
jgi:hypothetical protein